MIRLHTVTTTVIGRHARGEARYLRQHTGTAPEPTPALRPLWHDLLGAALLAAVILPLVFV